VTRHAKPVQTTFTGAAGNRLAADVYGEAGAPVLLLHGGGQTRHAWRATAERIAAGGRTAYAVDQRGHGDAEWVADGAYAFPDFAADARAVGNELAHRTGARPIAIGASLGGIAALLAEGAAGRDGAPPVFSALVLVDITPRVDLGGVEKIQGFMRAHAREGFASIGEAADAVAAYLPHRPRPRSHEGLRKNLRQHPDGRWRWHWDPRFLDGRQPVNTGRVAVEEALVAAARSLQIPALLVRGASSELVQEAHAKEFLDLVPHAEYADVSGARHMVAGDRNDQFSNAILDFLGRLAPQTAAGHAGRRATSG
jgi:pimeloyl-ACP methyl ester carboxylesterase